MALTDPLGLAPTPFSLRRRNLKVTTHTAQSTKAQSIAPQWKKARDPKITNEKLGNHLGFGYGHGYHYGAANGSQHGKRFLEIYPKGFSPRKDVNFLFENYSLKKTPIDSLPVEKSTAFEKRFYQNMNVYSKNVREGASKPIEKYTLD